MSNYQDKHELDVSEENEIFPPDYQHWIDAQKPAWELLDKDSEARKELQRLIEHCF